MSFIQKNKRKIIFLTILLLTGLAFLLTWLQRKVWHNNADINSKVYPLEFTVKDTFFYRDETAFEGNRRWEFGDGNISLSDSGYYQYRKPGYYQVKLSINNNYSKVFNIRVLDTVAIGKIEDSVTAIDGPSTAMQFENVVFRARTKTAKLFSWKFGETNSVDSKEPMVIYAYQSPGDYVVTLYTDEMQYPVMQKIRILPSYKLMNDSVSLDDMYKRIDDDFKYHL